MTHTPSSRSETASEEREQMHAVYRQGGRNKQRAPHVIYAEADCPHPDCGAHLQAIDFRLEAHGKAIHHPLVRAWWDDTGFAGRCPHCRNWIHFTIHKKRAISEQEARQLPLLPENWYDEAIIL